MGLVSDEVLLSKKGAQIGTKGTSRLAYIHIDDDELVIKECFGPSTYANWAEWIIWTQILNEPKFTQLLGACHEISFSGRFLVMERLDDLTTDENRRKRRYPEWTTDNKADAFGVNTLGAVKIRDYGMLSLGQTLARGMIHDMIADEILDRYAGMISDCQDLIG